MRIKTIREEKHLSQTELAKMMGIERTVLSRYENGKLFPNSKTIEKFAKVLKVDIQSLFEEYKPTEMLTELETKVKIVETVANFSIEKLHKVLDFAEKVKND